MKTATIPSVRIDSSFRNEMEQSLEEGESLTSLVRTAVRKEVTRRQVQSEFVRRGLASIGRTLTAGNGVPAERVIVQLQSKLDVAHRTKRASTANETAGNPSAL